MQMNKAYKSVWNESLGAWVAASEINATRGKPSKATLAANLASASLAVAGATAAMLSSADASAQGTPYIGYESNGVDTCSKEGAQMGNCAVWSSIFTNVSGSNVAYLTSQNGQAEGGVWAGNLSSGMFFGSGTAGMNRV